MIETTDIEIKITSAGINPNFKNTNKRKIQYAISFIMVL